MLQSNLKQRNLVFRKLKFKFQIILYKRQANNLLGILIGNTDKFIQFKEELNNYRIMKQNFETLRKEVNYLDIKINLEHDKLSTRTFKT